MKIKNITIMDHFSGHPYTFIIGEDGVIEIRQHRAQGHGDKWFYDIIRENMANVRLFEFLHVEFDGDPE